MSDWSAYTDLQSGQTIVRVDLHELDALIANVDPRAEKIIDSVAYQVEGRAKQFSPVDTGALKNSIHSVSRRGSTFRGSGVAGVDADELPRPSNRFMARVGPGVEYAIYLEFGTSRMAPRPYIIPAVEAAASDFEKAWGDLLK